MDYWIGAKMRALQWGLKGLRPLLNRRLLSTLSLDGLRSQTGSRGNRTAVVSPSRQATKQANLLSRPWAYGSKAISEDVRAGSSGTSGAL